MSLICSRTDKLKRNPTLIHPPEQIFSANSWETSLSKDRINTSHFQWKNKTIQQNIIIPSLYQIFLRILTTKSVFGYCQQMRRSFKFPNRRLIEDRDLAYSLTSLSKKMQRSNHFQMFEQKKLLLLNCLKLWLLVWQWIKPETGALPK